MGKLPRNLPTWPTRHRAARSRAHAWTAGELRRFLEHVARRSPRSRCGGWRPPPGCAAASSLGLTWRALDLDGARLSVEQQLVPTRGGATLGPPKSRRSHRTVALDPETVDALRAHRETQLLERDFAGPAYVDGDLVFADALGGPIHPQRLTEWFCEHRKADGHPDGHACTRCATQRRRSRSRRASRCISSRRGSVTTRSTILTTYAHLLPQSDELAAERIAARWWLA